ncbi:hypothetical protein [Streptomyces sp. NPDC096132]|uniref:hypothetical protein n=1 Tax=Streptomyces sp. NPDC096132 TaxID=3366075 RepID=UPI0038157D9B
MNPRSFVLTSATFAIGTAVAPSYGVALTRRLVAAAGAAAVTPVAPVAVTPPAPPHQRGRALAVVAAGVALLPSPCWPVSATSH